jgi:hypothetical protein
MNNILEIKNRKYVESDDLKKLAITIMEDEGLEICPPATIKYLKVYPYITKTKAGVCIRASNELRMFSGAEYLIEMSGDLWDSLDKSTQHVLMLHELLHPYPVMNRNGEWEYKMRDHDIQDFHRIIAKYGIDWFTNLKTQAGSVYDLTPDQEASISL